MVLLRAEVLRFGLLQIEFGVVAALEQLLGNFQAALLQFGIFVGDAQPRFRRAQGHVGFRHLRMQQHQDVFVVGVGREVVCIGGLRWRG